MNSINSNLLENKSFQNFFVDCFFNKYIQSFEFLKSEYVSFIQVIFDISYPLSRIFEYKYEHIQIFNYNFQKFLTLRSNLGGAVANKNVIWLRSVDENNMIYFQYIVLIDANFFKNWHEIIDIVQQHWSLTLGTDGSDLISTCNNRDSLKKLKNGLVFYKKTSEFEQARQERLMLQQVISLAEFLDHEKQQKDGWMISSTRQGELKKII